MTKRQTLSVAGLAVGLFLAAAPAFAHGEGGYLCQTSMPKSGVAITHCITWAHTAAARLQTAHCDPAAMNAAAMRTQCADLEAHPEQPANG